MASYTWPHAVQLHASGMHRCTHTCAFGAARLRVHACRQRCSAAHAARIWARKDAPATPHGLAHVAHQRRFSGLAPSPQLHVWGADEPTLQPEHHPGTCVHGLRRGARVCAHVHAGTITQATVLPLSSHSCSIYAHGRWAMHRAHHPRQATRMHGNNMHCAGWLAGCTG